LLFGIKLSTNFKQPYFSSNSVEFWHRWHISLSTWFRDYVFIPLGGSRDGVKKNVRNIFIVFLVSGLWHGAEWTFILWGIGHFVYYLFDKFIINSNGNSIFHKLNCFIIISILWIPFRSTDTSQFISLVSALPDSNLLGLPFGKFLQLKLMLLMSLLFIYEFLLSKRPIPKNLILHQTFWILLIVIFGNFSHNAFVYFQF
jgi:alginate O-acetyltransferase complex protein AlgI